MNELLYSGSFCRYLADRDQASEMNIASGTYGFTHHRFKFFNGGANVSQKEATQSSWYKDNSCYDHNVEGTDTFGIAQTDWNASAMDLADRKHSYLVFDTHWRHPNQGRGTGNPPDGTEITVKPSYYNRFLPSDEFILFYSL